MCISHTHTQNTVKTGEIAAKKFILIELFQRVAKRRTTKQTTIRKKIQHIHKLKLIIS